MIGHEQKECVNPCIWNPNTLEFKRYSTKLRVALARIIELLIQDVVRQEPSNLSSSLINKNTLGN